MVQTPKPPIRLESAGYFLNDIFSKICYQVPLLPETPGVGRRGRAGLVQRRPRGCRATGRGPGVRRGAGVGGRRRRGGLQGAAASRPGARSLSPSRSGAGEGGAKSGRRLCRRSRGAATLAPRPPPALTRTHTRAQEAGGPGPTGPPWTPP